METLTALKSDQLQSSTRSWSPQWRKLKREQFHYYIRMVTSTNRFGMELYVQYKGMVSPLLGRTVSMETWLKCTRRLGRNIAKEDCTWKAFYTSLQHCSIVFVTNGHKYRGLAIWVCGEGTSASNRGRLRTTASHVGKKEELFPVGRLHLPENHVNYPSYWKSSCSMVKHWCPKDSFHHFSSLLQWRLNRMYWSVMDWTFKTVLRSIMLGTHQCFLIDGTWLRRCIINLPTSSQRTW